jgi:hypothetical protein
VQIAPTLFCTSFKSADYTTSEELSEKTQQHQHYTSAVQDATKNKTAAMSVLRSIETRINRMRQRYMRHQSGTKKIEE